MEKLEDEARSASSSRRAATRCACEPDRRAVATRRRLRGIPVVAKSGVGGTMRGTSPLDAVLWKEARSRR